MWTIGGWILVVFVGGSLLSSTAFHVGRVKRLVWAARLGSDYHTPSILRYVVAVTAFQVAKLAILIVLLVNLLGR